MVETFFKTIKSELIWPVAWQSRQQSENAVARYIDGFYNPVRRHSSFGFQSPIAFERRAPGRELNALHYPRASPSCDLAFLADLDRPGLVRQWKELFGTAVPKSLSRPLAFRYLAFELQSRSLGGLPPGFRKRLTARAG
jgi:Integrase core domain